MPFLRRKKGSKSAATDPINPNSNDASITTNESAPSKETKSKKFGRKKKNNAVDTLSSKSSEQSQATQESNQSIGPLGANNRIVTSKRLSIPQQPTAPQSRGNTTVTSHTITTASTSTNQSNNSSSVSALFDHNKAARTNALQQRQISHRKRVGGINQGYGGGGVSPPIGNEGGTTTRPSQQPRSQPQNIALGRQQPPQFDLFASSQGILPTKNTTMPTPATAMPMTRSGWSMVSNASTAMNSVQYIESLDNLPPGSPGSIRGKVSFFLSYLLC